MKDIGQGLAYEDFGAQIEEEAKRRRATGKCWMITDLGDGDVVVMAWFGTPAKMFKLKKQMEGVPSAECAWLWRNASSLKIYDALHAWAKAHGKEPLKPKSKKGRVKGKLRAKARR
jgi:hypothetical protein